MSFTVVVIPEDDRLDRYILEPVLKAALVAADKRQAKLRVVSNPRPRGIDTVLTPTFFQQTMKRYGMADLFLYCIDRDGKAANDDRLATAISDAEKHLRMHQSVNGRTAHQEIEVWGLAACPTDVLTAPWSAIREDPHPKERYFRPTADKMGIQRGAGAGREHLGRQAGAQYSRVRQLCPELQEIEDIFRSL